MGGFAPSNQFTAYTIISQARNLAKTVEQSQVLEAQIHNFYRAALIEIVTLLNGAVDRSYLTKVEAIDLHASDVTSTAATEKQIVVQSDPIMGSGVTYMRGINILQKRVKTGGSTTTGIISDPLKSKQIDRILSVEQRVEGVGTTYNAVKDFSGQMKTVKLGEMQSIMKRDFAHGAYKDDLVYLEIGGDPVVASPQAATTTAWTSVEAGCDYLPTTGTVSSDAIFNAYWIRIRKDRLNSTFALTPNWVSASDYFRILYTIWFNRLPNFPLEGSTEATNGWLPDSTSPSRFIDLPDKHMPLLIKRVYTYCLLQLQQDIPAQLGADIMNDYNQIYAMMDADVRSTYRPQIDQVSAQLRR
jgi:hypothetical protein